MYNNKGPTCGPLFELFLKIICGNRGACNPIPYHNGAAFRYTHIVVFARMVHNALAEVAEGKHRLLAGSIQLADRHIPARVVNNS